MAAGDRGSRGRGAYGKGADHSRGSSHRGGGRSGEGKNNDRKTEKHANMGDLNDKFKGHEQKVKEDGPKSEEKGIWDKVTDFVEEKVTDVEHWFKGEEATGGFAPMGGPSSYGLSTEDFDNTIGRDRQRARSLEQRMMRQVKYFEEAPMDYVADLIRNPLVAGGLSMTGMGLTAFGVTAVDAITDYMQMEATPMEALGQLAAGTLDFTPVGEALGPMSGIARAAIDSPEDAVKAAGGLMGTQVGAQVAPSLARAVTANPMVQAGITAAGIAGMGVAGRKAVETAMKTGTSGGVGMEAPDTDRDRGADTPTSRLAASGREAVKASQRLAKAAQQPVDLYARTVRQLPYYGLQLPQQLPMYGV